MFKVGDVVCLPVAGVYMTVEHVRHDEVKCVWFDTNNKLHRAFFDKALLVKRANT